VIDVAINDGVAVVTLPHGKANALDIEFCEVRALLSPAAFAQTKMQIRQTVAERMAQSGAATDRAVTEIWTAPETLGRVRDYVARTLKKA
jgi:enoyl-CoA hydratase